MGADVGVGGHVGGELRGCVYDVEGHAVVYVGRPVAGAGGFDDGAAAGGVAGYVVGEAGEVGGELGFVGGAGGRHGCLGGGKLGWWGFLYCCLSLILVLSSDLSSCYGPF